MEANTMNEQWVELKIKEQENRLVAIQQDIAILRLRANRLEERLDDLINAVMKLFKRS